jgi:hypothetical protein
MDLALQLLSEQVVRLGPVLGCGFYACAYPLLDYPGYVIKVSGDPSDAAAWQTVIKKAKHEKVWPKGIAHTPIVFAFPSSKDRRPYILGTETSWGGLADEVESVEPLPSGGSDQPTPAPAGQFFGIVQEELSSLPAADAELLTEFGLRLRVRGDLSDSLKGYPEPTNRFKEFTKALRWLDKHKILTRDIKGDNAMAGPDGEWQITDLGINCAPSVYVPDLEEIDLHALLGALPKRASPLAEARRRFAEDHPAEVFEPLSLFGLACIIGDIIAPDPIPGLPGPITAGVLAMDHLNRLPDSRSRPPTVGGLCDWPEANRQGLPVRALDLSKGMAKVEYLDRNGAVLRWVPIADLTNCRGAPRPPSVPTKPRKYGERPAWLNRERLPSSDTITVYHGTCESSAKVLISQGFDPERSPKPGANQGRRGLLYVTTVPENALWFAEQNDCSTVVKIHNVPLSALIVDPEDGSADSVSEEISQAEKWHLPAYLALRHRLSPEHFSLWGSTTGSTMEACPYVPGTDPVEYIRADHTEIRGLLSEVARVLPTDPPRARKMLRQARLDIEQHLVAEEDEVFPLWEARHPEYAAELHGFINEHPGILTDICGLEKRLTLPGLLRFMAKVSDHSQREDHVFGIDVGTRAGYEERMRSRPRNRPAVKKAHRLGPEVVLLTKRGGAHQNRPRDVAMGRAKPKHKKPLGE